MHDQDDVQKRADRALKLVQMGELSESSHFDQGPIVAICSGIPTRSFLVG